MPTDRAMSMAKALPWGFIYEAKIANLGREKSFFIGIFLESKGSGALNSCFVFLILTEHGKYARDKVPQRSRSPEVEISAPVACAIDACTEG